MPFGEISVILSGKIDQLPPVMKKVQKSENSGFFIFWLLDKVVTPTKNERSKG